MHDLSVILYLIDEEPVRGLGAGNAFLNPGVEDVVFCFLRFPSGKIAHLHLSWLDPHKMRKLTVVGRDKMAVFDDMELERKVTIYEKWPEQKAADVRRVADPDGRHPQPEDSERRAAAARARTLSWASSARAAAASRRATGLAVVRVLERLQHALDAETGSAPRSTRRPSSTRAPCSEQGVKVLEGAVVGKQPTLSPRSTATREPLAAGRDRRRDSRLDQRDRLRWRQGSARA